MIQRYGQSKPCARHVQKIRNWGSASAGKRACCCNAIGWTDVTSIERIAVVEVWSNGPDYRKSHLSASMMLVELSQKPSEATSAYIPVLARDTSHSGIYPKAKIVDRSPGTSAMVEEAR